MSVAGNRAPGGVLPDQPLVQVAQDVAARHLRAPVRIQGAGFGPVAALEHLRPRAAGGQGSDEEDYRQAQATLRSAGVRLRL